MDNKFYVSLEAARLLKEKGCDIEKDFLTPVYKENGDLYWSNYEDLSDKIPAYTKAEAIDWLESKGITIEVHRYRYDDCDNNKVYRYYILEAHIVDEPFSTRLEAEDAAIIKACELL